MITEWILSENAWEYEGTIEITSTTSPEKISNYELLVDGVRILFDEPIEQILLKSDG